MAGNSFYLYDLYPSYTEIVKTTTDQRVNYKMLNILNFKQDIYK